MDIEASSTPVVPVHPPAPYVGGKRRLASQLIERISATPHHTYAEAFVGMGGVFFRRKTSPSVEVINDRNGEVANLFRILQRHYPQFMDTLRFQLSGRKEFERLKQIDPSTLTDLERAGRFLYLQRLAFGGKVTGRTYGVDPTNAARFNLTRLEPLLSDIHERLAGVTIECLDWLEFIDRYDRAGTLFYLDPPYYGWEADYGRELFSHDQFEAMALRLARLKGRFILSINDTPEARMTFDGFPFEEVGLRYAINREESTAARELIIRSA